MILQRTQGLESRVSSDYFSSDRYALLEQAGRGCWGVVYKALDNEAGEDKLVAIKVHEPNDTARRQMVERELTLLDAVKKEGKELKACANVVPRKIEKDRNGRYFIVMPYYEKFFSDVIEEKGLPIEQIMGYARDIANGISEIHKYYGMVHCDIKPDNIAVDEDGKLLISDLGTSTFSSMGSSNKRDHMGHIYTRDPLLFRQGAHPQKFCDLYSFGSLLYKMFTGKYLFEEEIDKALKEKGQEGVDEFMKHFGETFGSYGSYSMNIGAMRELAEKKLKDKNIPDQFKDLIKETVCASYGQDGSTLKRNLERTIEEYRASKVKKDAAVEFRKNLRAKARNWFLTGTATAGFIAGMCWLHYFAPDYATKPSMMSQVQYRPVDTCEVKFEIEKEYPDIVKKVGDQKYEEMGEFHFRNKGKTVADTIATEWIAALNETGADANAFEMHHRYMQKWRGAGAEMAHFYDRYLKDLLVSYMPANQVKDKVIDLEDLLTMTLVGDDMRLAQKAANSFEFEKYVAAKDVEGKFIIPEDQQEFLRRVVFRVSKALPQKVQLKSGSSQSELAGISP